ncbi:MAG: chloride channel protein [Gammaproteobacteria bacterium]|nr:chloride channel protein [Gammaproteobacteria bacterium]
MKLRLRPPTPDDWRRNTAPLRRQLAFSRWKPRLVFWSGALIVGLAAGGFTLASGWAMRLQSHLVAISPYWCILATPAGLMLAVWLTQRVFPGAQGSGIPQAIAAMQLPDIKQRARLLSLRLAIGKILLTVIGLLSGASIGREGPTVHVGAGLLFSFGRLARFPPHFLERSLILAGGAAGIAGAFNTPIAGIVFAIEELGRSFEERATSTVLTAVVITGIVVTGMLGNYTYFGQTSETLVTWNDWLAVPLCGVVGGLLGGLFSTALIAGQRRIARHLREHGLRTTLALGLWIALLGLLSHGNTYGTGYDQARELLHGNPDAAGPLFPIAKIAATFFSYISGIPGGLFSPSLSAGAGVGADLARLLPSAPVGAVVLLGMTGYFVGVVQTPLTAAVIVMEMIGDHGMILPIMATAFIALGASKLVCRRAVYWALADAFLTPEPGPQTPVPTQPISPAAAERG